MYKDVDSSFYNEPFYGLHWKIPTIKNGKIQSKSAIAILKNAPKNKQTIYAHELIHYHTPEIILGAGRFLPYRKQPAEVIAFGLEKRFARTGFKTTTSGIEAIPRGQILTPIGVTPREKVISYTFNDEDTISRSLTKLGEVTQQRKTKGVRLFEFEISTPKSRLKENVITFIKEERGELLFGQELEKVEPLVNIKPVRNIELGDTVIPKIGSSLKLKGIFFPILTSKSKSKTKTRTLSDYKIGTLTDTKIRSLTDTKLATLTDTKVATKTKIKSIQQQREDTILETIQELKTINPIYATTNIPRVPNIKTPPPSPPIINIPKLGLPGFKFDGYKKKDKKKKLKKISAFFGRTPSGFSAVFGIKGQRSIIGEKTGLGIRPIVGNRI